MRHDNGRVVSGYITREIEPALQCQTIGCFEADMAAHESILSCGDYGLSQMLNARRLYAQVHGGQIFAVAGQPNY